jgi:hypothetical protein
MIIIQPKLPVFETRSQVEQDPQAFMKRFSLYEKLLPKLLPAIPEADRKSVV